MMISLCSSSSLIVLPAAAVGTSRTPSSTTTLLLLSVLLLLVFFQEDRDGVTSNVFAFSGQRLQLVPAVLHRKATSVVLLKHSSSSTSSTTSTDSITLSTTTTRTTATSAVRNKSPSTGTDTDDDHVRAPDDHDDGMMMPRWWRKPSLLLSRRSTLQTVLVTMATTSITTSTTVGMSSRANSAVDILDGGSSSQYPSTTNTNTLSSTATTTMTTSSSPSPSSFNVYQVIPDSGPLYSPNMVSIRPDLFLQQISSVSGGTIWLGEHHNSLRDHNLQTNLIQQIYQIRQTQQQSSYIDPTTNRNSNNNNNNMIAIGLEQIQVQYQHILDEFIAGKLSLVELQQYTEWDTRWNWSFENYQSIFICAQQYHIPLIALNVNSEHVALVEKNGLPGLPIPILRQYIPDGPGFAAFATSREFSTYIDYVVSPSYDIHAKLGLLQRTVLGEKLDMDMSFRNFLSGRILWDEAMASKAYEWTSQNPNGLLIGLVGADHVKFRNGIPGRYARMVLSSENHQQQQRASSIAVLLNPTLIDTRPFGSVSNIPDSDSAQYPDQLTLQLLYLRDDVDPYNATRKMDESTGGVLPLADYLLIG